MGDLRIECRFKNAALYNAMVEVCGRLALEGITRRYPLIRLTSESTGISRAEISGFLCLTHSPWKHRGAERRPTAVLLAEWLDRPFEDLFPVSLYKLKIPRIIVKEVESSEVLSLQEARKQKLLPAIDIEQHGNLQDVIDQALLRGLTPREEKVLRMQFGIDGEEMTQAEIAAKFSLSKARIHQVASKALRKLRHPSNAAPLRSAAMECGIAI